MPSVPFLSRPVEWIGQMLKGSNVIALSDVTAKLPAILDKRIKRARASAAAINAEAAHARGEVWVEKVEVARTAARAAGRDENEATTAYTKDRQAALKPLADAHSDAANQYANKHSRRAAAQRELAVLNLDIGERLAYGESLRQAAATESDVSIKSKLGEFVASEAAKLAAQRDLAAALKAEVAALTDELPKLERQAADALAAIAV